MHFSPRVKAILQGLLVAFLWSTSWVLIKIGLQDIPSLTFAGLRYTLAWLILLPFFFGGRGQVALKGLPARRWVLLVALGVVYYSLAQGGQFIALGYLPAVTVNLLLGFSPVVVALLGGWLIGEPPRLLQWLGLLVMLGGAFLYFYPSAWEKPLAWPGVLAAAVGIFANAIGQVWGRSINREKQLNPLAITVVTMGIGSVLMLVAGIAVQGLPPLNLTHWLIIAWMAAVNTAFGFTLWNHTMRTLSALESSVIANTMMVQVPILAVLFLGETQTPQQWLAMGIAILGVVLVQVRKKADSSQPTADRGELADS